MPPVQSSTNCKIGCWCIEKYFLLQALFRLRTFFPKLQTFKTSKHFWINKSQFLFYSYTLAYFPAWFAWKNKLECNRKIKIVIYICKNVLKFCLFEVFGKILRSQKRALITTTSFIYNHSDKNTVSEPVLKAILRSV